MNRPRITPYTTLDPSLYQRKMRTVKCPECDEIFKTDLPGPLCPYCDCYCLVVLPPIIST